MTILEDLVWRGDNDMKKTVLFIALLVGFACEDKEESFSKPYIPS